MPEEEDDERRRRVIIIRSAAGSSRLTAGQAGWLADTANEIESGYDPAAAELAYAAFLVGKSIL